LARHCVYTLRCGGGIRKSRQGRKLTQPVDPLGFQWVRLSIVTAACPEFVEGVIFIAQDGVEGAHIVSRIGRCRR
jgi:hypothetical protein